MTLIIGTDADTNEDVCLDYNDMTLGISVLGRTGHGKSTLLLHMILEAVRQIGATGGSGACSFVFDPHGDLCKDIIGCAPGRFGKNIEFIVIDPMRPFQINPFYFPDPSDTLAVDNHASNFVLLFKKSLALKAVRSSLTGYSKTWLRSLLKTKGKHSSMSGVSCWRSRSGSSCLKTSPMRKWFIIGSRNMTTSMPIRG